MDDKEWIAVQRDTEDTPIKSYSVRQQGEFYNPDLSFIVLGSGAADRLSKLLNLYGVHYELDHVRSV